MKTSTEIIRSKISDPTWSPKPYSYGKWFIDKLLGMGFYWEDDEPPHFKVRSGNLIVTVSPYPNVVIVEENKRAFTNELICWEHIPQNDDEFDEFWNIIKLKI